MNPIELAIEVLKQDPNSMFEGVKDINGRIVAIALAKMVLLLADKVKEDNQ